MLASLNPPLTVSKEGMEILIASLSATDPCKVHIKCKTYSLNPPVSRNAPPTCSRSGKLSEEAWYRLVPFRFPLIFFTPERLREPMNSEEILTSPLMVEQDTWVSTSSWLVRVRLPQA